MTTFTKAVAASADDASLMAFTGYQETDTAMLVGGIGASGVANSGEGWRFLNVTIPQGSTVTSAYLTMIKSGADNISLNCRWAAILEDNTPTFSSGNPPGSRAISTNIAAGDDGGNMADGASRDFPNDAGRQATLGAALTEVFARAGWASGNALGIVCNSKQDGSQVTDFARANFKTWDEGTHANAAILTVTYTAPAASGSATAMLMGV